MCRVYMMVQQFPQQRQQNRSLHSHRWRSTAPPRWRRTSEPRRSARPRSPPGRWTRSPPTSAANLQRRGRKDGRDVRERSIYWMECAAPPAPSGQRKWNDISQPHSHTQAFITQPVVWAICMSNVHFIHYAGRQCQRTEQVFPFWDVEKGEETFFGTQSRRRFSCSTAKQRLITTGKQGEGETTAVLFVPRTRTEDQDGQPVV